MERNSDFTALPGLRPPNNTLSQHIHRSNIKIQTKLKASGNFIPSQVKITSAWNQNLVEKERDEGWS